MKIILILMVFTCLLHGCTSRRISLRQTNSPEVIEAAKQFRENEGRLRASELEIFMGHFLQTHIQKPGKVTRLNKPIIKNRISKEDVIKLLGPPDSQNEDGTTIFYDLGRNGTVSSRGTVNFENDYPVDFSILTEW